MSAPTDTSSSGDEKIVQIEGEQAVITKDAAKEAKREAGFADIVRVLRYCGTYEAALYCAGTLAAMASGTSMPLSTVIFGGFVSSFTRFASGEIEASEYMDSVEKYTLYFVYLFIGRFVATCIYTTCFTVAAIRVTKQLRVDFVRKTLHQEVGFFDTMGAGATSVAVTTNANQVQTSIAEKAGMLVHSTAMFVSAIIIAMIASWKLTLIACSAIPALLIPLVITVAMDAKHEGGIMDAFSNASTLAEEVLSSVRTVHSFTSTKKLAEKYAGWLQIALDLGLKKSPTLAIQFSAEFFCSYGLFALAFWQGVRLFSKGQIDDAGDVVTVLLSMLMATMTPLMLAPSFPTFAKGAGAAGEMLDVIDRMPTIDSESETGAEIPHLKGDLEIRDVTFQYPSRPQISVLKGISFTAPARKVTALVGASGSGKSTIVGLIERWFDTSDGGVFVDGVNVRDLKLKWLRSQIGLVQQEPVLFNDTIYNNVANGLVGSEWEHAPEEKKRELVKEACISANADEFIMKLKDGYDSLVGERGGLVSGGQKQRIAIARSIIKNPSILLLDEATSALDPRSEGAVQKALDAASVNRTTIVIAHKLATVKNADKIVVMKDGNVIEEGTHAELVAKGGAYAKLVEAQDLGTEDSKDKEEGVMKLERERTLAREKSAREVDLVDEYDMEGKGKKLLSLPQCLFILLRENWESLWHYYIIAVVAGVIAGLVYPVQAFLFANLADTFTYSGKEMVKRGDFYSGMFFVVAAVLWLAYFMIGIAANVISQRLTYIYRLQLFKSFLRQDISFFDAPSNNAGALTAKLSLHPTNLQNLVSANIVLILILSVNLISSAVFALVCGWKLALVTLAVLPILFTAGWLQLVLEGKMEEETMELFAESGRFAAEAVGAIRTVTSLTLEKSIVENYNGNLSGLEIKAVVKGCKTMFFFSLVQSVDMLVMALAFWYGGKLVSAGEYSNKQFYQVFIAVVFGGQAAGQFFAYTTDITKAHTAANYIIWIRDLAGSINKEAGPDAPDDGPYDDDTSAEGDLDFNSVSFAYPLAAATKVLRDLSFSAKKGQYIALVGPSGCGKSTVVQLILRFYDVVTGSITLDSLDIREIPTRAYRSRVSLVGQEPILYQGTIRENITLGLPSTASPSDPLAKAAEDAQITAALKAANIADFISSLPSGLDTECGSRGTSFSGGQKQRIAIARALIRDPKVLVLDEATSALDTESERVVQEALEGVRMGRTTVAVAHRLSTIKRADVIHVFEDGRIVESGGHRELVERRGRYYAMCEAQKLDA